MKTTSVVKRLLIALILVFSPSLRFVDALHLDSNQKTRISRLLSAEKHRMAMDKNRKMSAR